MDLNMRKSFYLAPCGELNKEKSTIAQVVHDNIQENADKSTEEVINDEKKQEQSLDDNSTKPQVVNLDEAGYHPLLLDFDDSIEAKTPETPSTLVNETSDDETDSELDISICSSIELNVSKDESE